MAALYATLDPELVAQDWDIPATPCSPAQCIDQIDVHRQAHRTPDAKRRLREAPERQGCPHPGDSQQRRRGRWRSPRPGTCTELHGRRTLQIGDRKVEAVAGDPRCADQR